jgi:hypothetical protein
MGSSWRRGRHGGDESLKAQVFEIEGSFQTSHHGTTSGRLIVSVRRDAYARRRLTSAVRGPS